MGPLHRCQGQGQRISWEADVKKTGGICPFHLGCCHQSVPPLCISAEEDVFCVRGGRSARGPSGCIAAIHGAVSVKKQLEFYYVNIEIW